MFEKSAYVQLSISSNEFVHKGRHYALADVAHVLLERVSTTQKMNFSTVGTSHSASLVVTLKNGKRLSTFIDEATFILGWNKDKSKELEYLLTMYQTIAQKTFEQRLQPYLDQLSELGYFVHDNCLFYPIENKIVFNNRDYDLSQYRLYRYPCEIVIGRMGSNGHIKKDFALRKAPKFNTQTDPDVVFALLRHYFNIAWE